MTKHTIVYMDEMHAEREAQTKALREAGYRVIEAATRDEALLLAEQERPALVLLPRQSDEQFRILADSAPTLMWMNGPDGCEFVNQEYLRFLGVKDVEVRGYDWAQFIHPDDRKRYVTAYLEAATERRLFEATFRFRRHDGEYRWMKSVGTPRVGADGDYIGFVGSTLDITDIQAAADHEPLPNRQVGQGDTAKEVREAQAEYGPSAFRRYGVAAMCTAAAVLMRWLLDPIMGGYLPLATVFGFVGIAVWYGGWGPALFTVVASYVAANWLFFEPKYMFSFSAQAVVGLSMYLFSTLILIAVGETMRRAQRQARLHAAVAVERQHKLEAEVAVRKQAEEMLAAQAALLHLAHDAIIVRGPGDTITFWNRGAEQTYGWTQEEAMGRVSHDLLKTRFPLPLVELSAEVERKNSWEGELIHTRKDGGEIVVTSRWSSQRDASGHQVDILEINRDITERKRAEEALHESETRYRNTFANAAVGIAQIGLDGRLIRFNDAVCLITGYTREDLQTKTFADISHPDDIEADWTKARQLLAGELTTYSMEKRYRRKGRGPTWVNLTVSLQRDEAGSPQHFIYVIQDINARKQAEQALRHSEQHLELLSNSVPALIFYLDLSRRYRSVNDAFTGWFGLRREDILGLHMRELVGDEAWDIIGPRLDRAYAGETVDYETEVPYRFGGTRWIHATYTPHRNSEEAVGGVIVLVTDITRSKKTEEALRQSETRLRTFSDQLEQLVAERTEELVQSQDRLRALATELNLTEQRERKKLAMDLHDHLAQMLALGRIKLSQTRHIPDLSTKYLGLIKDTDEVLSQSLTYTKTLVADLAPPVLHDFGLPAGLKWLGEQMRSRHALIVTVTTSVDDPKLPEDRAVLLFQSVRELLINASKHACSNEATVTLARHNGDLRIEVRDHGVGFDLAAADSPTALSSKFGLFSIRERMRALGGQFDLQSIPGQGTTATLSLPLASSGECLGNNNVLSSVSGYADRTTQRAPFQQNAKTSVLLVDDHSMVRQGLRTMLESYADIEVIGEAANGEEAVTSVEQLQPAIVVMDINMPKMNGIDATAKIKSCYPHITVIGLSVNVGRDSAEAMRNAGAAMLLTKDAAVDELYIAIQQSVSKAETKV
ncbi:MAG TPA: PAS domain S-box protein [Nitrospiraceae bacterium]|nr:PAS domain S-box protein [Nitrospiraceae bacterium]